ncbi:fasciclin domain-containing protein [Algoriphagus sp. SE2]|uniref:fasciclin domain-containing protein n=1 Tax=Algoriphagus sp. SE2 TaxID=3141536 RepID=UPI0031CCEAB5
MKKLGSVLMLAMLIVASSFTTKTNSVHETKIEADIVDLAVSQDFLTTLVAAVKAGDLVDVLKGEGPFTVFAPTNEAFAKLPAGTVETLLKPENKAQLVKILTYHVVPGKVMSTDLKNGQMAKTVEGSSIKVTLKDGKAMINNATVTAADIEADNGVVHVIDTVIMPPM